MNSVEYTAEAGFNPAESIVVMNKLEEALKQAPPRQISYFKTHPLITTRIRHIKQDLGLPLDFKDILN